MDRLINDPSEDLLRKQRPDYADWRKKTVALHDAQGKPEKGSCVYFSSGTVGRQFRIDYFDGLSPEESYQKLLDS